MTPNGDSLTVVGVQPYTAPECIRSAPNKPSPQDKEAKNSSVKVDRICGDCSTSFAFVEAMLSHYQISGHVPQVVESGEVIPSNNEVHWAFCNCALKRGL